MAHQEYRRKLDAIMSAAERSVGVTNERTSHYHQNYTHSAGQTSALGNIPTNISRYADPYASSSSGGGPSVVEGGVAPRDMQPHHAHAWEQREEDFSRQLRICMKEVAELRSELAAEREGRHQLQQLIAKRSKEEVMVEIHAVTNSLRQEMRELDVNVQQRVQESETSRAVEKRKVDDALRLLKTQERSHFDIAEQYRDQLDEMRQRVDGCVNATNAIKAEVTHQLENEKGRMEHRLDVELERYSEMHRQHQTALSDTRHSVQREVGEVSKTVKSLVESTWDDRVKTLQKMLNENLYKYQRTQEQQTDQVSTLSGQVANYLRESKRDLNSSTSELRDRLAILEGNAPVLASQMDRVQRKADTAVESNSKIAALVDVLREAADKATAQAVRSAERAQKVEDTMTDRDGRILALESQTATLAGFERWKNELDATKRSVQRVDGQTETVRQIADRCERLVQDIQQNVDQAADRGDSIEKKAVRAITRLEASEGRLNTLFESNRRLEETSEKLRTDTEAANQMRETLRSKLDTVEHRLTAHVDSSRQGLQEANDELRQLETRLTASEQQHFKEHVASQSQKMERMDRRLTKVESGSGNTTENLNKIKESVDSARDGHDRLSKKVNELQSLLQRQADVVEQKNREGQGNITTLEGNLRSTKTSISMAEENISKMSSALSGRIDDLDSRMGRLQATQRSALSSGAAGSGASSAELSAALAHVDSLSQSVLDIQRQYGTLERKMQQQQQGGFVPAVTGAIHHQQQPFATTATPAVAQPGAFGVASTSRVAGSEQPKPATQTALFTSPTKPAATGGATAIANNKNTTTTVVSAGSEERQEEEGSSAWGAAPSATNSKAAAKGVAGTATTETTSVVSSVHLNTTAPKPSAMNFDSDEEESFVSEPQQEVKQQQAAAGSNKPSPTTATKPPLGTTTHVGSNKQLAGVAATTTSVTAAAPSTNNKKSPFDESTGTSGSDVPPTTTTTAGGNPTTKTAAKRANSFGAIVESEDISEGGAGPQVIKKQQPTTTTSSTAPPKKSSSSKSAYMSAYTSSEGEQTPDRDFKGAGAPAATTIMSGSAGGAKPKTSNPFDQTDSEDSFTLAGTSASVALPNMTASPASPQSGSDAEERATLKDKLASAGKSNPFFNTATTSAENTPSPKKAAPTTVAAADSTPSSPEGRMKASNNYFDDENDDEEEEVASPISASDGSPMQTLPGTGGGVGAPATSTVRGLGGGASTTDDSDIGIPGRRQVKHYASTTGDSSEGVTPKPAFGVSSNPAPAPTTTATTAPVSAAGDDQGKVKKYGKAAALAAKNYDNEFDDGTSSEDEGDALRSRRSATSSKKTASSKNTDDLTLTITPSTKTGAGTGTKGSSKVHTFDDDDDDDEALDDDALAGMM